MRQTRVPSGDMVVSIDLAAQGNGIEYTKVFGGAVEFKVTVQDNACDVLV